jgi:hypothetical protein
MFTIENSEVIGSWTETNKGNNKITELRTILQVSLSSLEWKLKMNAISLTMTNK